MAIQIYDKNHDKRVLLHEGGSSSHQVGIQEDDVLSLTLTSYECVRLMPGDYAARR